MQDTTQFTYDFADLIGITDPLLNTTSFFHDPAGRLVQRTDPLGNTTKYQYNNLNQLTQITDALQGVTTLTYDSTVTCTQYRTRGSKEQTINHVLVRRFRSSADPEGSTVAAGVLPVRSTR
jgi:YD repeat-containing protein